MLKNGLERGRLETCKRRGRERDNVPVYHSGSVHRLNTGARLLGFKSRSYTCMLCYLPPLHLSFLICKIKIRISAPFLEGILEETMYKHIHWALKDVQDTAAPISIIGYYCCHYLLNYFSLVKELIRSRLSLNHS